VRLKASFFVREAIAAYQVHGKKGSFLKPRGDVQEDDLKLGKKPNLELWGKESIEKEGTLHTDIDGVLMHGKIPTLQGNYYAFFDGVYDSIVNNTVEPVTAQDGIRVMQIIEAVIKSSELKKLINL
jgi:scyllo-inositol 2-dehydrogenase (NADP+)